MPIVFDEVVGNVDGGSRGSGSTPSGQGGEPAPAERDAANLNRVRASLRLIEHRKARLRAT